MMIYELALVEDRGSYWEVTNVTKNTLDSLANRDEKTLKLSYMSYEKIKKALEDKSTVRIKKSLITDEVTPGEIDIIQTKDLDNLKYRRQAAITKLRMLVTPELTKVSGFALYGFIVLNNEMANAGYYFTNDNREEKYLEMLETGDEEMILKLEDYLNYKDEIERLSVLERKLTTAMRAINQSNEEEIEEVEKNFLDDFYSNY